MQTQNKGGEELGDARGAPVSAAMSPRHSSMAAIRGQTEPGRTQEPRPFGVTPCDL